MSNEIENNLAGFVAALDEARAAYFNLNFPNQHCAPIEVHRGRKYAKICTDTSVHSFVNLKNGDILKAASFKAPAPNGVRGSIFSPDFGLSCVGPFGAIYINGPNIGFRHKTTPPRMPAREIVKGKQVRILDRIDDHGVSYAAKGAID